MTQALTPPAEQPAAKLSQPAKTKALPIQIGMTTLDLNDLTGRAAYVSLAKANEASDKAVRIAMREIYQQAKVDGVPVKLHLTNAGNRYFLRWLLNHKAAKWEAVAEHLVDYPAPVRKHYELLQRRVLELNVLTSICQEIRGNLQRAMRQAGWIKD